MALSGVCALGVPAITPRVGALVGSTRGFLPFCFAGQSHPGPIAVGLCFTPQDACHRLIGCAKRAAVPPDQGCVTGGCDIFLECPVGRFGTLDGKGIQVDPVGGSVGRASAVVAHCKPAGWDFNQFRRLGLLAGRGE